MIDIFSNVIFVLAVIFCVFILLIGITTFILQFYYFIKELKK